MRLCRSRKNFVFHREFGFLCNATWSLKATGLWPQPRRGQWHAIFLLLHVSLSANFTQITQKNEPWKEFLITYRCGFLALTFIAEVRSQSLDWVPGSAANFLRLSNYWRCFDRVKLKCQPRAVNGFRGDFTLCKQATRHCKVMPLIEFLSLAFLGRGSGSQGFSPKWDSLEQLGAFLERLITISLEIRVSPQSISIHFSRRNSSTLFLPFCFQLSFVRENLFSEA